MQWTVLSMCGALVVACEANNKSRYPRMFARPEHRDLVLERIGREPYSSLLENVRYLAGRPYEEDADPGYWDPVANGNNGVTAHANAFLAWLLEDGDAAAKARQFLQRLSTDWYTNEVWDIDVWMPYSILPYTNAWDLLKATPWFPKEEAEQAAQKITEITKQFADMYVFDEFYRTVMLTVSQNNHSIRTAAVLAYVALAFPWHPDAGRWADWAFTELDFFWSTNGLYVLPDGGVSEGPFYYGFGWGVSVAVFIALDNLFDRPQTHVRDCCNRLDEDPWTDHGCVDGEVFEFHNPLYEPFFRATAEWSVSLRLPSGLRPPLDDSYMNPFNGGALLTSFGGGGLFHWDWANNRDRPYHSSHGIDLTMHHLVYFDDAVAAAEPPFTTRFMPEAGNAVFRSDWSYDARWLLLVGESGVARKTVHDHLDGTSFSMAAYGEYLLIDPGYYRPEQLDVSATSAGPAHNVIVIEGETTAPKGPWFDFGDADAWIRNTFDGERVEYAEAHQDYQEAHIERSVVFIDGRYFVVCDRVETALDEPRPHAWRLNGYAGYGAGGLFELRPDGARWERERAGVDVFVSSTATGMAVSEPPFVEFEVPHVHLFALTRELTSHAVVDATVLARAPGYLALLLPYRVGAADPYEQPLPATALSLGEGVVGWTVEVEGAVDLALLRARFATEVIALPGGRTLDTDAEFVVLRLQGARPFAVMARGTRVRLDGATLATAPTADGVVVEEPDE